MARGCSVCNHPLRPHIDAWLEEKAQLNEPGHWRHGPSFQEIADRANDLYRETYGEEPRGAHFVTEGKVRAHAKRNHARQPGPRQLVVEGNQLIFYNEDQQRIVLDVPALKHALTGVIALGAQNIIADPSQITVVHLLRAVELLWKMDRSSIDRDEFMEAILDALHKGKINPESPLGKALAEREKAKVSGED